MDLDIIVIGGGAAGEAAGFAAAAVGAPAVLVERDLVGGSCPFWACMPSKTLLNSAARRACDPTYEWSHASARRDWMISREGIDYPDDSGHVRRMEAAGTRVIRGEARITGPGAVEVRTDAGVESLSASNVIVAAGSEPFVPPIPGIDDVPYWTSREATSTRELPSSLVILGGGVIGVEMAQVFVRFGVRVTLVEGGERILSRDHPLTSKAVADQLEEEGLVLRTGVTAQRVRAGGAGRIVELSDGTTVEGAELLVAVGRRPADLRALGVEEAGATLERTRRACARRAAAHRRRAVRGGGRRGRAPVHARRRLRGRGGGARRGGAGGPRRPPRRAEGDVHRSRGSRRRAHRRGGTGEGHRRVRDLTGLREHRQGSDDRGRSRASHRGRGSRTRSGWSGSSRRVPGPASSSTRPCSR